MSPLMIALGALVLYIAAYHTYGRWLARKIFRLDATAIVPSVALNDDQDFVPTKKSVIFGHHFTSIAGTGPIVGPAIAVVWGWVPALLWVLLGSILIGAVHDFGSLVISMRNRGQTVGDVAGRLINPRIRLLFLFILFMGLTIVLAIFGLVIANVFKKYPSSILPCLLQIPLAMGIGAFFHRKGGQILIPSLIVLLLMYLSVYFGDAGLLHQFNTYLAGWTNFQWVIALLIYAFIASVLPVWVLLQPRDYINSLQLLSSLGLVLLGLIGAAFLGGAAIGPDTARPALGLAAEPLRLHPTGAPAMFPFLFITIACGAISGFHCLVSSGTSSKQIACETDAQFVGYGSMLTEGFLAVIVILACTAGIGLGLKNTDGAILTGSAAYAHQYASFGLGDSIGAFVEGSANFLKAIGLNSAFAIALMGVFVASFAATTMDTACRLQRYVIQEIAATFVKHEPVTAPRTGIPITANPLTWLSHRFGATFFAILLAGIIAAVPPAGQPWSFATAGAGGKLLWPLFGATNQLLAGLAFLVILFWMWRRSIPVWFIAIPAIFMLILPGLALFEQLFVGEKSWLAQKNWLLLTVGASTLFLQLWMMIEALLVWPKARGVLEPALAPLCKPN